jgi:hypothetical protein
VPPHAFGVGPRGLAYLGLRRGAAGLEVREKQALPFAGRIFGAGALGSPVEDETALAEAVRALVGRLAAPPHQASLVLPDAWARAQLVELGALPERPELRLEVLRFRLRRLVPFRVEDLRIDAVPIAPVAGQADSIRALALCAAENVVAALERAFAAAGVRLGQVVGESLARLEALRAGGSLPGLAALAAVDAEGFTLVVTRDGEPVLWRQKSFDDQLEADERAPLAAAELRLTRSFLTERLTESGPLGTVLLVAPPGLEALWSRVLEEGLECPVATLGRPHLPLADVPVGASFAELAPLVGAACREVA